MENIDPNTLATKNEDAAPPVVDEDTDKLIAETEARLAALKARVVLLAAPAHVAPEPVKVVAPEPVKIVLPPGKPIECDPVAAKPNEIVQVITQLPPNSVLRGLKVSDGLKVSAVMVGRSVFPAPGSSGSWEECIGKVVPNQSFLILLVQNMTQEHLVARATWYVTGDGASVHPSQATQAPRPAPAAPPENLAGRTAHVAAAAPLFHDGASQGYGLNMPMPNIPASRAVTPGTNEVCILIQRGECERLLASLSGGQAISEHEKPSIVRQVASALQR
jgi:hypothetical protein